MELCIMWAEASAHIILLSLVICFDKLVWTILFLLLHETLLNVSRGKLFHLLTLGKVSCSGLIMWCEILHNTGLHNLFKIWPFLGGLMIFVRVFYSCNWMVENWNSKISKHNNLRNLEKRNSFSAE